METDLVLWVRFKCSVESSYAGCQGDMTGHEVTLDVIPEDRSLCGTQDIFIYKKKKERKKM